AREGELSVRSTTGADERRAGAVLTAPDAVHAIDARGLDLLLVFVDPEGDIGGPLRAAISEPIRLFDQATVERLRAALPVGDWDSDAVSAVLPKLFAIVGAVAPARPRMHPAVRRALSIIRSLPAEEELSLERLADQVKLSPSRLQHAFSESVG